MAVKAEEMVVRTGAEAPAAAKAEVVESPLGVTAVTAEELGATMEGPQVSVPSEIRAAADAWTDAYKAKVSSMVAKRVATMPASPPETLGEVQHLGYVYWDLLSISPVQFIGLAPYRPQKIIASGELALFQAVLFINPTTNIFNPIAGTTVLGGRRFRIRFEQVDLTNVTNGPDFTFTGVFPPTAPVITIFRVFIVAPDPDITDTAQPFAAFATNVLDVDADPAFPPVPGTPPRFEHDIPLRYLIYRK